MMFTNALLNIYITNTDLQNETFDSNTTVAKAEINVNIEVKQLEQLEQLNTTVNKESDLTNN